ncbi:DUF456 domain-containing protein [Halanaerobium sp. ST460_2HS_T2]|uniref:DUF456 domain-containing protein n=1 Tax=Halanaerobium sp. ST460_2HS_T2 TaxID=2183914 RepID=UPI000DF1A78E|nr:DUF456 domain-containing protein [Halanaerobium sp. ST460_2HS_T2]RCW54213.1 hypothetical protein DFR80_12037 [Halanaerobium sp. ST460_2HS_T2]
MEIFLLLMILILFTLEIAAIFLPVLPDSVFFWAAVILYRIIKTDISYSPYFWTGAVLITVIIFLADYLANAYFIKRQGGTNRTIIAAVLGMILGTLFLGPLGFIIGPFLLIFIAEYWQSRNKRNSFKLALSSIFAFVASTASRLGMQIFLMIWFFIEIY